MPWPTDNLTTTHLDQVGDSPAMARPDLLALINALKALIAGRGTANGACELDGSARIPNARYRRGEANGVAPLGVERKIAPALMPYRLEIERRNDDAEMRVRNWDGTWGPWTDLTGG